MAQENVKPKLVIRITEDFTTATLGDTMIQFNPNGNVVIYTNQRNPSMARTDAPVTPEAGIHDTPRTLEVGDRIKDGTVVIAVDLKNNQALFAPEGIFGGKAKFDTQNAIPEQMNKQKAHGHTDWRSITNAEGNGLYAAWNKVAPKHLRGNKAPQFWSASSPYLDLVSLDSNGKAQWGKIHRNDVLPVPVVRNGPARI